MTNPANRPRRPIRFDDGYLPLTDLATYAGLSTRYLWTLIKRPVNPLPHYRFGHKIAVRRADFDAWALAHCRVQAPAPFDAEAYVDRQIRGQR